MAQPAWWRRARAQFGIRAPRMAVRTRLPWWGRTLIVAALVGLVGGMWWWGFDFGRIFGGLRHNELEQRLATLGAETAQLRTAAADLRARNAQLESDLAISRGSVQALERQVGTLTSENGQLKEEAGFLRELVADPSTRPGLSLPRLFVERQSDDLWHYRLLVVRGGGPKDDFTGHVVLQATIDSPGQAARLTRTLTLPDDQPDTAPTLKLAFKYYQRVEGTFRVPTGSRVATLVARAYEGTGATPLASRTYTTALPNP
ncbi:MAG: DUF6776 family protein [Casimicrobiaceae bacterium]